MRGPFAQDSDGNDHDEDEIGVDVLPPALGRDERRMQVHAYNLWSGLLGTRDFPSIGQLDLAALPDFAPSAVLIDFTGEDRTPRLTHIGHRLADQAGIDTAPRPLDSVPEGTLLSRFTDHAAEIFANRAPIGFEADFETPAGTTMLYRGILLPFAEDGSTITQILGVINWKEQLGLAASEALMREVDDALARPTAHAGSLSHPASPPGGRARRWGWEAQSWDNQDWANRDGAGSEWANPEWASPEWERAGPAVWPLDADDFAEPASHGTLWPDAPATGLAESPAQHRFASLADRLAAARALAATARHAAPRDHGPLYAAIGAAHDLSLAAEAAPQEAAALLAAEQIAARPAAPLLPYAKLVFGAGHDKTRLTEYATALAHARRLGLGMGALAAHLAATPGGLKAVVATQRLHRPARAAHALPAVLAQALSLLPAVEWADLGQEGDFTLAVVRHRGGRAEPLGRIKGSPALTERLLRQFLAEQGQAEAEATS